MNNQEVRHIIVGGVNCIHGTKKIHRSETQCYTKNCTCPCFSAIPLQNNTGKAFLV